jgi:hypothetical protein
VLLTQVSAAYTVIYANATAEKKKEIYIEDKTAENTYSPGSLCNSFEIDHHHPARERENI